MAPYSNSQALQQVPFFAKLEQSKVDSLADRLITDEFQKGEIIFFSGSSGRFLYIITKGKVKITHGLTEEGQEAILTILRQGDFFGELALIDDSPRCATAVAIESTETLKLLRAEFIRLIREDSDFALHVLTILAKTIRHLDNQFSDVLLFDKPKLLARELLRLANKHGRRTLDGIVIDLKLTQTDLAEMIGANRGSINKALGEFRKKGWVQRKRRKLVITNHVALSNFAG